MTFLMALDSDSVTKILLLILLGTYLLWGILRDYRLVSHWEYKIWDMRRGTDREGLAFEINRMEELGKER
jgi:hypothetical protein